MSAIAAGNGSGPRTQLEPTTARPRVATGGDRVTDAAATEMTYLEAISDALREEMRRDETVFCLGEDIGAFGGAFKVTDGFVEEFGLGRRARHAAGRERDHRQRRRRGDRGPAPGLRDAVRRLHLLRLRPARQRRGEDALPAGDRSPAGRSPAERRRLLRRAVPLAEPRGVVHADAGAEGRGAGHRR